MSIQDLSIHLHVYTCAPELCTIRANGYPFLPKIGDSKNSPSLPVPLAYLYFQFQGEKPPFFEIVLIIQLFLSSGCE